MTPVQRLTGDFMTSSEMGHLKKLGTLMKRSSLNIFLGAEKPSKRGEGGNESRLGRAK